MPRLDESRETLAVDRQRAAGRHRRFARRRDDQRIEPRQLFFEQADAFSSAAPRSELLQTSSASVPVWCAGPLRCGRIS